MVLIIPIYRISKASVVLILALTQCSICVATPVNFIHHKSSNQLHSRQATNSNKSECGFEGNPDIYGLGIRIGVYLQWTSGLLANSFYADSVLDMLATNTIFLLAIFTALAIVVTKESVQPVEIVILLQLCFGFLFGVSSNFGHRVRAVRTSPKEYGMRIYFPLLGSTIRLCLASAICAYNIWFWFRGLNQWTGSDCRPYGLLFAKVDLLGRARTFFQVLAVCLVAIFGLTAISEVVLFAWNWFCYTVMVVIAAVLVNIQSISHVTASLSIFLIYLSGLVYILTSPPTAFAIVFLIPWIMLNKDTGIGFERRQSWHLLWQLRRCVSIFTWPLLGYLSSDSSLGSTLIPLRAISTFSLQWMRKALVWNRKRTFRMNQMAALLPILNLICIVWSIISIELMIKWNGITGVQTIQSVGQLIPFIIGVVGLFKLLRDLQILMLENYIYNEVMKSLLQFGPKHRTNILPPRKPNGGSQVLPAEQLEVNTDEIQSAEESSGLPNSGSQAIPVEQPEVNTHETQSAEEPSGPPDVDGLHVSDSIDMITNTKPVEQIKMPETEDLAPDDQKVTPEDSNIILTPLQKLHTQQLDLKVWRLLVFHSLKEELKLAREAQIMRVSVGDKIIEILQGDVEGQEESIERTNAILTLKILRRFKESPERETSVFDWGTFSKELHKVDVNPHRLAVRWLKEYVSFWRQHFEERKKIRRAEVLSGNSPEQTKQ